MERLATVTTGTYRSAPVEVFEINLDKGTAVISLDENPGDRFTVKAAALKNVVVREIW